MRRLSRYRPLRGAAGRTRGYGGRRLRTQASPLCAGPAGKEAWAMFTSVPSPSARELHRSQRALVAASLLACPPVTGGKRA